ncbi:hypothetical protein L1887_04426 [Cichorium endivia]|nr:hypothetical protein L1887_04426 [Cichorium endivia]
MHSTFMKNDDEDGEIKKRGTKEKYDDRSEVERVKIEGVMMIKYKRRRDRNSSDDEDYRKRDGKGDRSSNGNHKDRKRSDDMSKHRND